MLSSKILSLVEIFKGKWVYCKYFAQVFCMQFPVTPQSPPPSAIQSMCQNREAIVSIFYNSTPFSISVFYLLSRSFPTIIFLCHCYIKCKLPSHKYFTTVKICTAVVNIANKEPIERYFWRNNLLWFPCV